MLTEERKQLLLEELKKTGRIVAKTVSKRLNLSEDTIRRDLRELAAIGLLQRVHGGALPASPTVGNLASRRSMSISEKIKLAQIGASLVRNGQSLFIDGGTTNLELVRAFPLTLQATVFTHSPTIAAALENHAHVEVIVVGGKLFKHSMVALGSATAQAIESLRVDTFFLGITGIHRDEGLTTGDYEEATIKRLILNRAGEVITLVSSEKIGTVSAHRVCDLTSASTLVVVKEARLNELASSGIKILRA
jgi:DeoR/GlpR family transcriptional regulator of sugar metabolism